jgi:hypothetical protein
MSLTEQLVAITDHPKALAMFGQADRLDFNLGCHEIPSPRNDVVKLRAAIAFFILHR